MIRGLIGVVFGLALTLAVLFLCFSAIYLAVGPERAFEPGSFQVTPMWVMASLVVFAIAGIAGGSLCGKIARSHQPVRVLGCIVLIGWLGMAVPAYLNSEAPARRGSPTSTEALAQARTPLLPATVLPFVGAVGVITGGMVARRKRSKKKKK